ncbi:MAG: menaquinone biosynthesis decarboxylase [Bacteroidales bacterium]|nr:menaquinone biosynthesis decarboxylase [Bacteroidales bacterium]MDY0347245.1 menaquinone biosynthesis decarboxylase [Tenuifilaceae bacterium]
MDYIGLNQFVSKLEASGELLRVKEYVNPIYEIAEITDRICKQSNGGKAILFENTGTSFPVLTNAFGSDKRMAMALDINDIKEVSAELDSLFKAVTSPKQSLLEKIRMLPTLRKVARWLPKSVSGKGLCQQVIHTSPNLSTLPVIKSWPHDGGPFVTLPMVNTKDPNTGVRNVGMYRMQIISENETGMHWHRHKTGARHYAEYKKLGKRMPLAVALGGDPVYTYAATAPMPDNVDEYLLAGFLRKKTVKLVKGITVDIEVPYDADIVIEGYVDTSEDLIWEGPFGDHTGFYSLADWYPKFHVTCITHKRNAIYPATVVGVPPMEDVYIAKATEQIFLSPIKTAMLPEVVDMFLPQEGVAHNIALVKINKTYPGQAHKVGNGLWGAGQMMFNKIMVVLSSDIDIRDMNAVGKVFAQNFESKTDFFIGKGPLDVLDHASEQPGVGGKLLIDITEKLPEEQGESVINTGGNSTAPSSGIAAKVKRLVFGYSDQPYSFGFPVLVLSIDKGKGSIVRDLANDIAQLLCDSVPKVVIFVDYDIPIDTMHLVVWYASGNVDPARDCFIVSCADEQVLIIDGTRKSYKSDNFSRDWPNVVTADKKTIKYVDQKWADYNIGPLLSSPSLTFFDTQFGDDVIIE